MKENKQMTKKKEELIKEIQELERCKEDLEPILNSIMGKKDILFQEVTNKAQELNRIESEMTEYNEQILICQTNIEHK